MKFYTFIVFLLSSITAFGQPGSGTVTGVGSTTTPAGGAFDTNTLTGVFLPLAGGTMSGDIVMDTNAITGVQYLHIVPGPTSNFERGSIVWDEDHHTLGLQLTNGVTRAMDNELVKLVTNKSGDTISNGTIVVITGTSGHRLWVDVANYDNIDTSRAFGMVTEPTIANNQQGWVTTMGAIHDLDTNGLTEGDEIWLSKIGEGHQNYNWTTNMPSSLTNAVVFVGYVGNAHPNEGVIEFSPEFPINSSMVSGLVSVAAIFESVSGVNTHAPVEGGHTIAGSQDHAAILSGTNNTFRTLTDYSVIVGGWNNRLGFGIGAADASFLGGGRQNDLYGSYNVLAGGRQNNIWDGVWYSVIAGGYTNYIDGDYNFIGGGLANTINNAFYGIIGSGELNLIDANGTHGVIGGGKGNWIKANSDYSTIAGGYTNYVYSDYCFIGGGSQNLVSYSSNGGTVAGGAQNEISNGCVYSIVAGGFNNTIANGADNATVSGGTGNDIKGTYSTISGGSGNDSDGPYGTIGGGLSNYITSAADYSTIPGGRSNYISADYSFAVGYQARPVHDATFVANMNTSGSLYQSGITSSAYFNVANGFGINLGTGVAPGYDLDVEGDINFTTGIYSNGTLLVFGGSILEASGSLNTHSPVLGGHTVDANATHTAVLGGTNNTVSSGADYGFLGGGLSNTLGAYDYQTLGGGYQNLSSATASTVGGGRLNAVNNLANYATIAGGYDNDIAGAGVYGFIGGGNINAVLDDYGAIAGGFDNSVDYYAFVGCGYQNNALGDWSSIVGGWQNNINAAGNYATILGGDGNTVTSLGDHSVVGGIDCISSGGTSFVFGNNAEAAAGHNYAWVMVMDNAGVNYESGITESAAWKIPNGIGVNLGSGVAPSGDLHVDGEILSNTPSVGYLKYTNDTGYVFATTTSWQDITNMTAAATSGITTTTTNMTVTIGGFYEVSLEQSGQGVATNPEYQFGIATNDVIVTQAYRSTGSTGSGSSSVSWVGQLSNTDVITARVKSDGSNNYTFKSISFIARRLN